jgi:hypothetical protein
MQKCVILQNGEQMYKPTIAFTPAGMDACALWRMFIPHINTPNSRFLFTQGAVQFDPISSADVACVQRMMDQGNIEYMKMARVHGIRLLYDLDDNVWHMPAYNPAKHEFESRKEGLRACVEWADVMTVSTNFLRKHALRELGDLRNVASGKEIPIVVIENVADLRLFKPHKVPRNRDTVRIGWGGSNTHAGDLGAVWNALPEIIEQYPNTELEVVGMPPPARLHGHPRVRVRDWCHISEFWNRLATWDWDIFLAPLEDNKFNRAKCLSTETFVFGLKDGKPTFQTLKLFLATGTEHHLPGPNGKWRKVIASEHMPKEKGICIKIRSGESYYVTRNHRFILDDGSEIKAKNLKIGDKLKSFDLSQHEMPTVQSSVLDYDAGWFVGMFLGDGCIATSHKDTWNNKRGGHTTVTFSCNAQERDIKKKLRKVANKFGCTSFRYKIYDGNKATALTSGGLVNGIIRQFVTGNDSYTKRLTESTWAQSKEFLRGVVDGWLAADGRKNYKHPTYNVVTFGITRNVRMMRDIQLACSLVGYRLRYRPKWAMLNGTQYKMYRGSVRRTLEHYQSTRSNYEVLQIREEQVTTIAVQVEKDELFVLPSGLVTHNSSIKMIEAGAMGRPCLATHIENYTAFAEKVPELQWLLCAFEAQWVGKLKELITNEPLRRELGEAMYSNVKENFNIAKEVWRWDEAAALALSQ